MKKTINIIKLDSQHQLPVASDTHQLQQQQKQQTADISLHTSPLMDQQLQVPRSSALTMGDNSIKLKTKQHQDKKKVKVAKKTHFKLLVRAIVIIAAVVFGTVAQIIGDFVSPQYSDVCYSTIFCCVGVIFATVAGNLMIQVHGLTKVANVRDTVQNAATPASGDNSVTPSELNYALNRITIVTSTLRSESIWQP